MKVWKIIKVNLDTKAEENSENIIKQMLKETK